MFRSVCTLEQTEKDIKVDTNIRLVVLDLDPFTAVRRSAADELNSYPKPLDELLFDSSTFSPVITAQNVSPQVLINNAGIIMAVPYSTPDGHESQFGLNHLGHFLFTRNQAPRIINLSSGGNRFGPARFDDLGFSRDEKYQRWEAYAYRQSKSANILFSVELVRRGVLSFSLHPFILAPQIRYVLPALRLPRKLHILRLPLTQGPTMRKVNL